MRRALCICTRFPTTCPSSVRRPAPLLTALSTSHSSLPRLNATLRNGRFRVPYTHRARFCRNHAPQLLTHLVKSLQNTAPATVAFLLVFCPTGQHMPQSIAPVSYAVVQRHSIQGADRLGDQDGSSFTERQPGRHAVLHSRAFDTCLSYGGGLIVVDWLLIRARCSRSDVSVPGSIKIRGLQ